MRMTKEEFELAWWGVIAVAGCGGSHAPEREKAARHDHYRAVVAMTEGDTAMAVAIYNGWASEPIEGIK